MFLEVLFVNSAENCMYFSFCYKILQITAAGSIHLNLTNSLSLVSLMLYFNFKSHTQNNENQQQIENNHKHIFSPTFFEC